MSITMDNILGAKLGENSGVIKAVFKKTINIRQYESEVIELESTLNINEEISGAERVLVTALLQAQLEYEAFVNLAFKGQITQAELSKRKSELEQEVAVIKAKAESVLGHSMEKYL